MSGYVTVVVVLTHDAPNANMALKTRNIDIFFIASSEIVEFGRTLT